MATIDCTIRLSDVQLLCDSISQKILRHDVVCDYLCQTWDSFSINSNNEVLVEWSIRDYRDENGRECVDLGWVSFPTLIEQLEEKDFISTCEYLVKSCERVFYNAYHEDSSDAFPLKFMMDKVRRLGL